MQVYAYSIVTVLRKGTSWVTAGMFSGDVDHNLINNESSTTAYL
jgi:hypothetical protein